MQPMQHVNLYQNAGEDDDNFNPYKEILLRDDHRDQSSTSSGFTYQALPAVTSDEQEPKTQSTTPLARRRRLGLVAVLPALISSVVVASAASALLGWLLSRHIKDHAPDEDALFRSALVVAESKQGSITSFLGQLFGAEDSIDSGVQATMYGLAFSTVAVSLASFGFPLEADFAPQKVNVVSLTTPFVLGVFAYLLAASWINNQNRRFQGNMPTPAQYGLILGLCGSSQFQDAFETLKYLARRRKTRPTVPTMLILALVGVIFSLSINFCMW